MMAHIKLPENMPGIRGLMAFRPETVKPLNDLVEVLLQDPSSLSKGERELIATYVSNLNECEFCTGIHGAIAKHHFGSPKMIHEVLENLEGSGISSKLKALLAIAKKVQESESSVSEQDIEIAKSHGATDIELHDTVLIAAVFCMFNRYVDGLATEAPKDQNIYDLIGKHRAENGYLAPNNSLT